MRKLLILALLLAPLPAYAQAFVNTYLGPISPAAFNIVTNTATSITPQLTSFWARIVCSVTCNYTVRISGNSVPATVATGNFLPMNWIDIIRVPRNSTISVIQNAANTGNGLIWVTEMGP